MSSWWCSTWPLPVSHLLHDGILVGAVILYWEWYMVSVKEQAVVWIGSVWSNLCS